MSVIGIVVRSDGFVLIGPDPFGRYRPWDAETVAILESFGRRRPAFAAAASPTAGLLAIGRDLYRFLDGEGGELTALINRAQSPLQFEIVSAIAPSNPAGLALLHAPWELLANDLGFLADEDVLGLRVVRRFESGQPITMESEQERRQTGGAGLSPRLRGGEMLPDRNSALSAADWRAMLALVSEVGEIAFSGSAQPHAHLTAELGRLIGAGPVWWTVVGGAAGPDDTSGPVVRSHVHGLPAEDLQRWEQTYLREMAYENHPMWPRAFATPGHARTFLRRDLVEDGVWYRSAHVADWSRGFGFDDVVSAIVPVGGGAELCIATMRPWGDRTFGAREREMMGLLAKHTAWLGRRPDPLAQAARSGNGVAEIVAGLAPRHRAMLELLVTGQSEKAIAVALQVSPRTAHKYIEQIYRAFDVTSRAELMALFIAR